MIEFFILCAAIAVVTVIGWSALCLVIGSERGLCALETIAISYMLGIGIVTSEMLLFYFLKLPLRPISILAPFGILVLVNAAIRVFRPARRAPAPPCCEKESGKSGIFGIFLAVGITFEAAYAFFRALIKPIESYDAVAIYAVKSKMLYLTRAINPDFFNSLSTLFPHPDYPLNIPFIETFLYLCMRDLNDQLVKVIFPLFFLAILAVLYCAVRRFATKNYALTFVFILATIPQFNSYAANAYHELPLACYCFASAILLFGWFERPDESWRLVISAILVGLAGWTKNEGLLYCVVNMTVLGAFLAFNFKKVAARRLFHVAAYPLIIVAMLLPWILIKKQYGISNSEIDLANLNPQYLLGQAHKMIPILYEFQKQFFGPKKWNIFWPAALTAIVIFYRRAFSPVGRYIALSIILTVAGYVLFYLISYVDVLYFLGKTWSRFLLHFLPVVVYWLAFTLKDEIKV